CGRHRATPATQRLSPSPHSLAEKNKRCARQSKAPHQCACPRPRAGRDDRSNTTAGDDNMALIETLFKLKEHHTTVKTEVVAGLTTFLTMAYIIFVNPA